MKALKEFEENVLKCLYGLQKRGFIKMPCESNIIKCNKCGKERTYTEALKEAWLLKTEERSCGPNIVTEATCSECLSVYLVVGFRDGEMFCIYKDAEMAEELGYEEGADYIAKITAGNVDWMKNELEVKSDPTRCPMCGDKLNSEPGDSEDCETTIYYCDCGFEETVY